MIFVLLFWLLQKSSTPTVVGQTELTILATVDRRAWPCSLSQHWPSSSVWNRTRRAGPSALSDTLFVNFPLFLLARRYANGDTSYGPESVCLSDESRSSIETVTGMELGFSM